MLKKLRKVKSCDNCNYWAGVPFVHCSLRCDITNKEVGENFFRTFPVDFEDCKEGKKAKEINFKFRLTFVDKYISLRLAIINIVERSINYGKECMLYLR